MNAKIVRKRLMSPRLCHHTLLEDASTRAMVRMMRQTTVRMRRQRPIPVTSAERERLERFKEQFEASTGSQGDWGQFLEAVVKLGLVALGTYLLAKVIQSADESKTVQCPACSKTFVMTHAGVRSPVVDVSCPHCQKALVVKLSPES